jgi:hypothetical protein
MTTATPVKLLTDYIDFYDSFFDREGIEFDRRSLPPAGLSKRDQFTHLVEKLGITRIPHTGLVQDFDHYNFDKVVVYTDEFLHAGNGKELMRLEYAIQDYPGHFASEFIPTSTYPDKLSRSLKEIWVGHHCFILRIQTEGDWRTNAPGAYKHIEIVDYHYAENTYAPLYAVDYALDMQGGIWAIDLNLAPGLRGTGVSELMEGKEAAEAIKEWIRSRP